MEDRTHALIAIVFLALLSTAAALVGYWLEARPAEREIYQIVTPYSVSGLSAEASVDYKGVKVGTVQRVGLDPERPGYVRIRIAVVKEAPITQSTYAELATEGFTGTGYIALDDEGGSSQPLATSSEHPAEIPMRRAFLQSLEHSGRRILARTDQIEKSLNALLDEKNRDRVASLLDRLDEASQELVSLQQALMPTVRELPRLAAQTRDTVAESQKLVAQLRVDARAIQRLGPSANVLSQQLTDETLPRLDVLIRQLDRTASDVDELSRTLERRPQSLLLGAPSPPPGPGEPGFEPPRVEPAP